MPTRFTLSFRRSHLAFLLAALLLFVGLLMQIKSAKRTALSTHPLVATSHFTGIQQSSRIQKSASARRHKRVLVVKPTANDRL